MNEFFKKIIGIAIVCIVFWGSLSAIAATDCPPCNAITRDTQGWDTCVLASSIGGVCDATALGVVDSDQDMFSNRFDNCPNIFNAGQEDADRDGTGDVCESGAVVSDSDNDGVLDNVDNCPAHPNSSQANSDGDNLGDACDTDMRDSDSDGVKDSVDNCVTVPNANQANENGDRCGDVCQSLCVPVVPDTGTNGSGNQGGGNTRPISGTSYTPAPYTDKSQGDIIPCDTNCTWAHLYVMVRNAIDFMLYKLALPLAVVSVAIAGWMFLVSGFNESARSKAKDILWGVLIGLFFVISAWLIVHFVVDILVDPDVAKNFPTEQKP